MTMPTTETCFECDGTGKVLAGSRAAMEQRRDELKAHVEWLETELQTVEAQRNRAVDDCTKLLVERSRAEGLAGELRELDGHIVLLVNLVRHEREHGCTHRGMDTAVAMALGACEKARAALTGSPEPSEDAACAACEVKDASGGTHGHEHTCTDAPEPKPCPKCERLTAQIHRSVGALNEALSGVMRGILKISDDAHDQIGEPIADLVDALVDAPTSGRKESG